MIDWKGIKRRVLCGWFNYHIGYPEMKWGYMWLYCTRCQSYAHPTKMQSERRVMSGSYYCPYCEIEIDDEPMYDHARDHASNSHAAKYIENKLMEAQNEWS